VTSLLHDLALFLVLRGLLAHNLLDVLLVPQLFKVLDVQDEVRDGSDVALLSVRIQELLHVGLIVDVQDTPRTLGQLDVQFAHAQEVRKRDERGRARVLGLDLEDRVGVSVNRGDVKRGQFRGEIDHDDVIQDVNLGGHVHRRPLLGVAPRRLDGLFDRAKSGLGGWLLRWVQTDQHDGTVDDQTRGCAQGAQPVRADVAYSESNPLEHGRHGVRRGQVRSGVIIVVFDVSTPYDVGWVSGPVDKLVGQVREDEIVVGHVHVQEALDSRHEEHGDRVVGEIARGDVFQVITEEILLVHDVKVASLLHDDVVKHLLVPVFLSKVHSFDQNVRQETQARVDHGARFVDTPYQNRGISGGTRLFGLAAFLLFSFSFIRLDIDHSFFFDREGLVLVRDQALTPLGRGGLGEESVRRQIPFVLVPELGRRIILVEQLADIRTVGSQAWVQHDVRQQGEGEWIGNPCVRAIDSDSDQSSGLADQENGTAVDAGHEHDAVRIWVGVVDATQLESGF
jgi:hypothetical protein